MMEREVEKCLYDQPAVFKLGVWTKNDVCTEQKKLK